MRVVVHHYDLLGNLIAETREDGSLIRAYVWVDNRPLAQIKHKRNTGEDILSYLLVIRSESSEENKEISAKLENFLKPLLPLIETIRDRDCIIRVAIFNSLATTTTMFSVGSLEALRKFNARYQNHDDNQ